MPDLPPHLIPLAKRTKQETVEDLLASASEVQDDFNKALKEYLGSNSNDIPRDENQGKSFAPVGSQSEANTPNSQLLLLDSTEDEDNLVTYLEVSYWLNTGYPTFPELLEETAFGEDYLRTTLNRLTDRLQSRGLPKYVLPPTKDNPLYSGWTYKFDPRFVMAVNIVTNVTDKRTKAAKLNEVGVAMAEWDAWLTNLEYYQYYQNLVEIRWNQVDETAKLQIIRSIESGDLPAIKYYHEYTGKFSPSTQIQVNMGVVIARVIETLTRFVEPAKLDEIASALTSEKIFEATSHEVLAPWEGTE